MPQLILYKDGVYNFYGTIADGPRFESGVTLEQLTEVIRQDTGENGLRELPQRLERAHRTGCSALPLMTFAECVECNRAGPNQTTMPIDEFVARFMTRRPNNG